ncbi:MAG: hypothetical protein ABFR90_10500 [Planctomycetota bacterium]
MVRQQGRALIIICSVLYICVSTSPALNTESLFSESIAALFVKQAYEVYQEDPLDSMRAEQAMAFLSAAASLNSSSDFIPEQMLRIGAGSCRSGDDYTNNLTWALGRYLDSRSDLEVASAGLRCILEQINTRIDREVLLEKLLREYSSVNPVFASDLATQLGLLAVEKADMQTAENYFVGAYRLNAYNQLAYSKLLELSAARGDSPETMLHLLQLRRALEVNPYDLDSALRYADMLLRFRLYKAASDAYKYIAQAHQLLHSDLALPEEVIHGWLLSCYRGDRMERKCLEIAEVYRDPDRLDLVLEVVAGKVLIKLGQADKGEHLLESAVQKAETLLSAENGSKSTYPEHLAWYYSFIQEEPEKALAWGNQAFQESPDRKGVKEMFAYSLVLNGQHDLAQQYVESSNTQIALLTTAMIELSQEQKQAALETLRAVIEMSPESFVAEKAMGLLKDSESDYIPAVDSDTIQQGLAQQYRGRVVPEFMVPSRRYSAKLLFNGSDFLYGARFLPRLVIENTSSEALVISDDGMLQGHIRIDAALEGDINVKVPNLLTMRFRPSKPILPGEHFSIPLDLNCGKLRKLLMTYPQAEVAVHFTAYLDPVVSPSGKIGSRIVNTEPIHAEIRRKAVTLSRNFLLQRLDVLSKGQSGQKYQVASLFTGLLAEQKTFSLSHADYEHVQIEPALLVDAVRKILVDDDWKIRVYALDCLFSLSISSEKGVVSEVSESLNHEKWPVRLMAMYLLAKAHPESFQKVLDWNGQHDAHPINRRMAFALGARQPEVAESAAKSTE